MTDEQIATAKALSAAATARPWEYLGLFAGRDAEFANFAVNHFDAMLAMIERQREEMGRLEQRVKNLTVVGGLNADTYVSDIMKRDEEIAMLCAERTRAEAILAAVLTAMETAREAANAAYKRDVSLQHEGRMDALNELAETVQQVVKESM